jgi:hypothetical protein
MNVPTFDELSPEMREYIDAIVAEAPPLTQRQQQRLSMLFQPGIAKRGSEAPEVAPERAA